MRPLLLLLLLLGGAATAAATAPPTERLTEPAAGKQPHILMILWDDYGWAEAGWHRNYTIAGLKVPPTDEVVTPNMNALVRSGIELDRAYAYKCCSPTRSAFQSGRHPYHVNALNAAMEIHNAADPVSGFAGIPRNMTGVATKLAAAKYVTMFFGKWDAGSECT
jgi:arylsulfatase B